MTATDDHIAALRAEADRLEAANCTGISASWCPVHGDCTCHRDDEGEPVDGLNDAGCPLHDSASPHGALGDRYIDSTPGSIQDVYPTGGVL